MTTTAPPRSRARRTAAWTFVVIVLVVAGTAVSLLAGIGAWTPRQTLDPEGAGPAGARALARTLDAQGVPVTVVRSFEAARAAEGTLVVGDTAPLSDAQVAALADRGRDVVLLQPRTRDARVLFDADAAGYGPAEPVSPGCDLGPAVRAGAVTVGTLFTPGTADTACYGVDGGFGLLSGGDARRVTLVDAASLFTNQDIVADGNAALALGLLGRTGAVVWYVPDATDADPGEARTLGELTPGWVTPAIVLLLAAAVAAGVWRGRRFGPLVAETLPVTVPAGETTRGRALLYSRSRDTAHAGALLRAGAVERLGAAVGLRGAPAEAVAERVAARLGRDPGPLHRILAGPPPVGERALVRLALDLDDVETALAAAEGES